MDLLRTKQPRLKPRPADSLNLGSIGARLLSETKIRCGCDPTAVFEQHVYPVAASGQTRSEDAAPQNSSLPAFGRFSFEAPKGWGSPGAYILAEDTTPFCTMGGWFSVDVSVPPGEYILRATSIIAPFNGYLLHTEGTNTGRFRMESALAIHGDAADPNDELYKYGSQSVRTHAIGENLCLLTTPSTTQSLTFPCSGSSSPPLTIHLMYALLATARPSLKSQRELALENLALRQQLAILKRTTKRPKVTHADRVFWVALSRLWTGWQHALILVKPETVIDWQNETYSGRRRPYTHSDGTKRNDFGSDIGDGYPSSAAADDACRELVPVDDIRTGARRDRPPPGRQCRQRGKLRRCSWRLGVGSGALAVR